MFFQTARREQKELLVALSKAIRKSDIVSVRALVQQPGKFSEARSSDGADLRFGLWRKGQLTLRPSVDWAVSCEKPHMALVLLEIADERNIGEAPSCEHINFHKAIDVKIHRLDNIPGLLRRGMDVAAQREVVPLSTVDTALSLSISSARREEARALDSKGRERN
eukprot:Skav226761  [mRNA]  locus=scaffold8:85216:86857:+ [translate_table: standard]